MSKRAFGEFHCFERLDADYVSPSLLNAERKLAALDGSCAMGSLVLEYEGPTLNEKYADEESILGYVDINAVDVEDGLTYVDQILYGDRPSRAKWLAQETDILVSNVRPNRGGVTFVSRRLAGVAASSGFTLLRLGSNQVHTPEFVYAFMRTRQARGQLVRRDRGSMYPAVLARDVLDVVVPTPPADAVRATTVSVREALETQDRFFVSLLAQSRKVDDFLAPYGSPPSPLNSVRGGMVDESPISRLSCFGSSGAGRIDAEYFRSEYPRFHEKCRELGDVFPLGEYFTISPGRTSPSGDEAIPTLKQAVLTNSGVNWSAVVLEKGTGRGLAGAVEGDILLASTAHEIYYVGRKADVVRGAPLDVLKLNQVVGDILILRPKDNKPDWLSVSYIASFLRHDAGRHQVQRCIRGLRGGHVYGEDLQREVIVPLPSRKWLEGFEQMSLDAEEARRSAKDRMATAVLTLETWLDRAVDN